MKSKDTTDTLTLPDGQPSLPDGLLSRYPWLTFLLPFIVFWIVGALEPTPTKQGGTWLGLDIAHEHYPIVYTAKIVATILAMLFVLRGYWTFPFRISFLAVMVGVVGACFWIGICRYDLEKMLFEPIGLSAFLGLGERSTYNPLEQLADTRVWAHVFLVIRFVGLVLVVPIIEEFFLRGFLMRYIMDPEWWKVPFGVATPAAIIAGTVFPMLMHPDELFAALFWFSMVTWLMLKTRNIWDCIAAHCITNLLLGLCVVYYGWWELM